MRLFIGLTVPRAFRDEIQAAWKTVDTSSLDTRPIEPEKWHFTLAFLDDVEPEHLDALKLLIQRAIEDRPEGKFTFTHFESFPRKNPSYIVARADAEPQDKWNTFIQQLRELVSVAAPNVDRKPWIPHVSIARTKNASADLATWSVPMPNLEWTPDALTLIQSEIGPNGTKYTDLHVFPFNV